MQKQINKYLDYLKYQKKYSKNTIMSYERDLIIYNTFLTKEALNYLDIEYSDIRLFFNYLNDFNYTSQTISRIISSIKTFYKYLSYQQIIDSNPFILVKSPKKSKKLPKFLYYNELDNLLETCDLNTPLGIRNRLILELLYSTGLRVSELVNIKLDDINKYEKNIKVFGKGSKERIVYFNESSLFYLNMYLNDARVYLVKDSNNYLLLNYRGQKITTRSIQLIIDKVIKDSALDLKISPHTLRHTFATHLLNEGCDILSVKELLGHESLKATQIYTHITDEALRNTYNKSHPRNLRK